MEPHTGFVAAAYAVTALVLGGLAVAILLDGRRQASTLASLTDRLGRAGREPGTPPPKGEDEHES